jgi:hypothetical protein
MVAKGSCLKKFLFKPPVFRMSSRTVEDALAMIEALPREISQLSRWTFTKALLQEALKSQKLRDLKTATRQLQQAISNERWS